jgi:hypothetical protein
MGPFYLKKTKMASISGISGSVAILFELGVVDYSGLPIFILCNVVLGYQKISNEWAR